MKKIIFVAMLCVAFCAGVFAKEILVQINPGAQWKKRPPQIAVWVEDASGKYLGTIYVTNSASKKSWKFAPKDGRPDSLPVWYASSGTSPAKSQSGEFDAVSSATPKGGTTANSRFDLQAGSEYFVKAEVNASFDYNETWTKKNSGVNGQPSLVYAKKFLASDEMQEFALELTGCGSVDGKSGDIHKDIISKITTAKEIVKNIFVEVK